MSQRAEMYKVIARFNTALIHMLMKAYGYSDRSACHAIISDLIDRLPPGGLEEVVAVNKVDDSDWRGLDSTPLRPSRFDESA